MALLIQTWIVLTVVLSAVLALVIGAQALAGLVRRNPPAAQPETAVEPATARPKLVAQLPAPRRAHAQDLLPSS